MIRRALLLALVLAHTPVEAPLRTSCKPTAPIDIDARIVGDPSVPFGITAKASSRLGLPIDLEIVLPDGVTAHAGRGRAFGKTCDVRLDASARDRSRREILVRATITENGAKLTRVVPLVLFDGPLPAAKTPVKVNSLGEAILEYSP